MELTAWPYRINQLQGRASAQDRDGKPDDPWNDCGPASIAAAVYWLKGWEVEPDTVRDWMYGDGGKGYTYLADLGRYVQQVAGYEIRIAQSVTEPEGWVRRAVKDGHPILVITKEPAGWNATVGYQQRTEFFHICPYTGFTDTHVIRHNPLGGVREELAWAEFKSRASASGWLLEIVTPE